MAVKLRLRRMGKKRQPIYRIVAADARSPRDGKFLETLGTYFPKTDPHTLEVNEERALYWLKVGAQPTDTVRSLLRQKGITLKFELMRKGLSEERIQEEMQKWSNLKEVSAQKPKKVKKQTTEERTPEETGAPSE